MASGVEFDEDKFGYGRPVLQQRAPGMGTAPASYVKPQYAANQPSGLSGWLMSHGWAKSDKAAQGILIGIVIINVVITYLVIKFFL